MSDDKKSYYAIIPANVRYDKRLTANAKLLYGEITALCNEKGYCWASNDYFASLYEVSKQSISHWIKQLCDYGYIKSELIYKQGSKEIEARYLTLLMGGTIENYATPPVEKFKDNTTSFNTTLNNTMNNDFETFYSEYPKKMNRKATIRAFNARIKEGFTIDRIMKCLQNYKADIVRNRKEYQYILYPSSFLNRLDDFDSIPEVSVTYKPVLETRLCPHCHVPLRGSACPQCYANFDMNGKEI
jgi:hypothetical protein